MRSIALLVALLAIAATAGTAPAQQPGQPLTAQSVANAFQAHGVTAQVGTDDYGDPYVQLQTGASLPSDYGDVFFWDCDAAGNCDSILMVASFQPQRRPVYLDAINQWNVDRRWVRAYIDSENYLVLDMDVSGYGGITDEALSTQVGRFVVSVSDFVSFLRR
ncbi:MAG: YbjN domain-containing protein [Alphaproteobacteria bacterium]